MPNLLEEKKKKKILEDWVLSPQHETAPRTWCASSRFLPSSHTPEMHLSSLTLHESWGYGHGHEAIKLFITGLQLIIGL